MAEHVLKTPETCDCDASVIDQFCYVCDGGLAVCAKCGFAEVQLDEFPSCHGNWRDAHRAWDAYEARPPKVAGGCNGGVV